MSNKFWKKNYVQTLDETIKQIEEEMKTKAKQVADRNLALLNMNNLTITLLGKSGGYEIDLERITTSHDLLDWLWHLRDKLWATSQMIDDFLYCFEQACEFTNQQRNAKKYHFKNK